MKKCNNKWNTNKIRSSLDFYNRLTWLRTTQPLLKPIRIKLDLSKFNFSLHHNGLGFCCGDNCCLFSTSLEDDVDFVSFLSFWSDDDLELSILITDVSFDSWFLCELLILSELEEEGSTLPVSVSTVILSCTWRMSTSISWLLELLLLFLEFLSILELFSFLVDSWFGRISLSGMDNNLWERFCRSLEIDF